MPRSARATLPLVRVRKESTCSATGMPTLSCRQNNRVREVDTPSQVVVQRAFRNSSSTTGWICADLEKLFDVLQAIPGSDSQTYAPVLQVLDEDRIHRCHQCYSLARQSTNSVRLKLNIYRPYRNPWNVLPATVSLG